MFLVYKLSQISYIVFVIKYYIIYAYANIAYIFITNTYNIYKYKTNILIYTNKLK